jgi:hypothetical protein
MGTMSNCRAWCLAKIYNKKMECPYDCRAYWMAEEELSLNPSRRERVTGFRVEENNRERVLWPQK